MNSYQKRCAGSGWIRDARILSKAKTVMETGDTIEQYNAFVKSIKK